MPTSLLLNLDPAATGRDLQQVAEERGEKLYQIGQFLTNEEGLQANFTPEQWADVGMVYMPKAMARRAKLAHMVNGEPIWESGQIMLADEFKVAEAELAGAIP